MSTAEKLLARCVLDGECVRWQGAHTPTGYGQMRLNGKAVSVHRVAHELWIGPIPEGLTIDHVAERGCRFRDCVNPAHLEAVTQAENARRGVDAHRSELCPHGHEFTPENTRYDRRADGRTRRVCGECKRLRNKRRPSRAKNGATDDRA